MTESETKLRKRLDALTRQVDRVLSDRKIPDPDFLLMHAVGNLAKLSVYLVSTAIRQSEGKVDIDGPAIDRFSDDLHVQKERLETYYVNSSKTALPLRGIVIPWPIGR
jgi:hypothetical protein